MGMLWRGVTARTGAAGTRWLRPVRWIWRPPERGLPDALRLRRLSAWTARRLAGALALAALVLALLGSSGAAPAWLAPVPLLLDLVLWRVLPRPLRLAVRTAGLAEETRRLNTLMGSWGPKLEFDPDLGHAGRPLPEVSDPALAAFGAECQAAPLPRLLAEEAGTRRPGPEFDGWLRFGKLRWAGGSLVLVGGGSTLVEVDLTDPDPGPRPRPWRRSRSTLPDRPTELVLLRERRPGRGRGLEVRVLLLDAGGRRLLTMPGIGLDETQLRKVASAARLSYSRYTFLLPWEAPGRGLAARLFPPRRGHVRIGGPVAVTAAATRETARTRPTRPAETDGDIDRLTR
ncbi:hypothetical protein [Streptacidiphilus rugosus]|uniref:hypothetical protein n=1 Tax=Streptacidiphilus rugosus TaxID=405783 RepID=UPI00055AF5CD|nr:hypothetical protein [Streptacidiphilus rugosus]